MGAEVLQKGGARARLYPSRAMSSEATGHREGGRTSLDVVCDLIPGYACRAQLEPVVQICIEGLGLAVELE